MWADFALVLSIVGSIASVVGLLLQASTRRQRLVHAIYGALVAVVAGLAVRANMEVTHLRALERQAKRVHAQLERNDLGDAAICRGQSLTVLAFLEKNRNWVPDTYQRAVGMAERAGVTSAPPSDFGQRLEQASSVCDCADALKSLLLGLASGGVT